MFTTSMPASGQAGGEARVALKVDVLAGVGALTLVSGDSRFTQAASAESQDGRDAGEDGVGAVRRRCRP